MIRKFLPAATLLVFAIASTVHADVVATFEFTGGSMTPTLGTFATDNGITVSDLNAPYDLTDGDADLEGVKTADNIAIQGADTSFSGSTNAIAAMDYLTFSVTIPSTVTVNLDLMSADIAGVDIFTSGSVAGHVSRIYSSIQGTDDTLGDTIGRFGYQSSGDNPFENQSQGLTDLTGNINLGGNVSEIDFQNLSDVTVTFYLPFIDNSSSVSRAIILDNLQIDGSLTVVPEPTAFMIGLATLAGCGLRRRR